MSNPVDGDHEVIQVVNRENLVGDLSSYSQDGHQPHMNGQCGYYLKFMVGHCGCLTTVEANKHQGFSVPRILSAAIFLFSNWDS